MYVYDQEHGKIVVRNHEKLGHMSWGIDSFCGVARIRLNLH
jgi:hypothetical protein